MKVMKFGGTSVASAERISHVADLITATDEVKIVVLSAMAGTTNALVEIGHQLMAHHQHEALTILTKLKHKYEAETRLLFPNPQSYDKAWTLVNETFFFLEQICYAESFTLFDEKKILARGELLSTAMMLRHLTDRGVQAIGLPALEYMRTDKQAEPDEGYIRTHLEELISRAPEGTRLFITEGYICRNAFGDIDNLQRGGSDYTATLVGSVLRADEIQIWTDIDGMHNNDPRYVDATRPVRRLHFEEASELAYFGAKILHPTCIQPAKRHGIPVRLLNTMEPSAPGTLISMDTDKDMIKAVSAKDNITMVRVRSSHQLSHWSFIGKVFSVFEHHCIPIDMIASTETSISLTIERSQLPSEVRRGLEQLGTVEEERELTIICVVGDMEWENIGFEAQILKALEEIPVRMISYGGSDYNLSLLVSAADKRRTLLALSRQLFGAACPG
ncbi:aspartate kinase [Porphyromonas sp. oral taxon 275]|uniref:aspartate kinase n=1 Tax=Porphyromonas sp. oral taxon 275 TaxID=712435 RepID=UPI001BAA0A4C|nr:aspartate kinase [Porphyromonas sp. oral taxon 275]QUB43803.1 aspartate kinase [Porphyromonas sp. oral taxon 275]